jgi:hypothetical protein
MSERTLTHRTRNADVTVGTATASSTTLLMADAAAGMVHVAGVTGTHTLTIYGSGDGVTFAPLYDQDGQAATVAVPADGGSCVLPDAVYPLRFVKLVSGTDLGTAAAVVLSLKS